MNRKERRAASRTASQEDGAPSLLRSRVVLDRMDFLTPSIGEADGYGRSAQEMIRALEALGTHVRLVGAMRRCGVVHPEVERLIMTRKFQPEARVIVQYSQAGSWMRGVNRKAIGFSMFETDTLPPDWKRGAALVHEVWVPSSFLVPMFEEFSGRPTFRIPLGVDGDAFPYRRRERGAKLRFLHFASVADERKGALLAIEAFKAAFPHREDVELVLRSQYPPALPFSPNDARVRLAYGRLSAEQYLDELYAADALLYPSRGEGFGLVPLEAMATGLPAIYGDHSGMMDYNSLGIAVESELVPAPPNYGGKWWQPERDALVAALCSIDTSYDSVQTDAKYDADAIREEWTWERTAQAMLDRLK